MGIITLPDSSEIISFEAPGVPIQISHHHHREGQHTLVPAHWHEEVELSVIINGSMYYAVEGEKDILLEEGDVLFINAKKLHYGYSAGGRCNTGSVVFHPKLIAENFTLYHTYVEPVLGDSGFGYLLVKGKEAAAQVLWTHMDRIFAAKAAGQKGYLMECLSECMLMWTWLYRRWDSLTQEGSSADEAGLILQKRMLMYITQHYAEDISLEDIARSASVSRSTCCRIFKEQLKKSPNEFLNEYRLRAGRHLLAETDSSVTEIAARCGFSSAGYFGRQFQKEYGQTPMQFRNEMRQKR